MVSARANGGARKPQYPAGARVRLKKQPAIQRTGPVSQPGSRPIAITPIETPIERRCSSRRVPVTDVISMPSPTTANGVECSR